MDIVTSKNGIPIRLTEKDGSMSPKTTMIWLGITMMSFTQLNILIILWRVIRRH